MKKLLVCSLFLLGFGAQAKDMMTEHGGLGYLYTDFNNIQNPAHLGLEKGTSFQGAFATSSTSTGSIATAVPSFATSNGKVGFEAFASRSGADLTNSTTSVDTVGANLGMALGKGSALGVSYQKSLATSSTNSGTVGASINVFGSKGSSQGPGLAIGANTTINDSVKNLVGGQVALGYAFKYNNSIEANVNFRDVSNWNDYVASGVLTLGSQMVYFSAAFKYVAVGATTEADGRLGFNLGKYIDVSGTIAYPFSTATSQPTYGGTLRVTF